MKNYNFIEIPKIALFISNGSGNTMRRQYIVYYWNNILIPRGFSCVQSLCVVDIYRNLCTLAELGRIMLSRVKW